MMKKYILLWAISASFNALAVLPDFNSPEILARANILDGYNLPRFSFLNSMGPVINNAGSVAFKVTAIEGVNNQGLWLKTPQDPNGKIVYVAPEERFLTEPENINENDQIAFNLYDEGVTDGLLLFDGKTLNVEQVLGPDDLPIQFYTYPQVKNNGRIYFRATSDSNDRSYDEFSGSKLNTIIAEGSDVLGSKLSYLFKPAINEAGQIAFKARMGEKGKWEESNPDSIVVLSPSQDPKAPASKVITIARDRDSDPRSPFLGFGNSLGISEKGYVAFMGVQIDSKKSIVLAYDNKLHTLAVEGQNGLSELELFTPKVNDQGLVVFRAKDSEGKRAIYIANESGMKRLIGEGDDISTDLGSGKILLNPNYPGLAGNIDMNDLGEIVFHCLVVNASDNKELGSAVYKITPKK